jgi:hypothetical protein
MSLPKYLSDYHNIQWVEFYKHSVFSAPVFVPVNCFTFDALSRLSDDNANLFFVTGCCFVCHVATHHIEVCPHRVHHLLFCKRLLDQPHCKWFESIGWLSHLIICYRMGCPLSWSRCDDGEGGEVENS